MKYLPETKLRYLSDGDIVKSIMEGSCEIPTPLNNTAKLMLEEIGKWE